jgi:acetyl esterase/lipase
MNELWRPFKEQLETFLDEHKITDEYFIKTQRAIMLYSWADILMRYPDWRRQVSGDAGYNPSEHYYDFVDELDLNDPELFDLSEYKTFLNRYFFYKSEEALKSSPELRARNYKPFRANMQVALDIFKDPLVRNEMMYPFMKNLMKDYNHKGIDDLIQAFKKNCSNQDYIAEIEKLYRADKAIRDKCVIKVYKTIGDVTLDVFLYSPSGIKKGEKRPALAFFHGGGWEAGKPEWGQMQCEHFSSLGLVALSFQYRLTTQHDTTPLEGIADAKSAIRWIRENAEELGVDPERIVASGFSAGGHLALCTAMIDKFDEPYEDQSISSAAKAFMLWVTPAKLLEDGWFKQILRGGAEVKECDPYAHVRPGLPPSVMFQGTKDDVVPLWSVKEFAKKMTAAGNRCDLHIYEGQTHLNWGDNARDVLEKMDKFLESIGYMDF